MYANRAVHFRPKKKKRKRMRAYLFTAAGFLLLYVIFFVVQWFIFHSPVFRVDRVVVQGNSAIASADIISLAQAAALPSHGFFRGALTFSNMLLLPDVIPSQELRMIPQLASESITKDYFSHTVTIAQPNARRSVYGVFPRPRLGGAPSRVRALRLQHRSPPLWMRCSLLLV